MKSHPLNRRRRAHAQRGMTLIEVMVAVLVFTVVFLAALGLYQAANRAYLQTDAATIQQQNARYAMDRVTETLRDAGANHNPLGRSAVPDEQLEGAWQSALFVRGDFDSSLESGLQVTYPLVTTGNDEIVGYVLRKAGGPNPVSLSVRMDLTPTTNRDAVKSGNTITNEEARTIAVAASNLSEQTDPPYQLARVTFDTSTGDPVYQVIADNVFRMSFIYRDANAAAVAIASGADAERGTRASVRRIGVNIVTMAERADFGYTDTATWTTDAFGQTAPTQPTSTRNRRKFNLSEEVIAVNLGRKGYRHNSAPNVNIAAPAWIKVCTGHCRSFYIEWAPTTTPGIATYKLRIQATSPFVDAYIPVPTTRYNFTQTDPTIQSYQFSVAGLTTTGLVGSYSAVATKTATHEIVPSVPESATGVAGAQGTGNTMNVTWTAVTTNTGTITAQTCTTYGSSPGPSAPPATWNNDAVDMDHYEVHRGLYKPGAVGSVLNGDFTPVASNRVDGPTATIGDLVNTTPKTNGFTDNTAAPCSRYFYRVKAFDGCGLVKSGNGSTAMSSPASWIPVAGLNPAIPQPPTPNAPPVPVAGMYTTTFTWPPVTRDMTNRPAAVAHYQLVRQKKLASDPDTAWTNVTPSIDVWQVTTASDTQPATDAFGNPMMYRYAVRAVWDCGDLGNTERASVSGWYTITCLPPSGNTMTVAQPPNGSIVSRPAETGFTPRVVTAGTAWTGAQLVIRRPDGTVFNTYDLTGAPSGSPTGYTFPAFDATSAMPGNWTFTFIGRAGSCQSMPMTSTVRIQDGTCGASLATAAWDSTSGSNAFERLNITVSNDCDFASMTLNGVGLTWSGVIAGRYVTQILYNNTSYVSGLNATTGAPGTMIQFTSPNAITLNGNANSLTIQIVFNDNLTLSGAHNNNDPGRFDSIQVRMTNPTTGNDEILAATPLNPPFP